MKKYIPLLVFVLLLSSVSAAAALDIFVKSNGDLIFEDTNVLGVSDKSGSAKSAQAKKESKQTVVPTAGKQVEITPKERVIEVTLKEKNPNEFKAETENSIESKRLRMEIPTSMGVNQLRNSATSSGKIYAQQLREEKQNRGSETFQVRNTYTEEGKLGLELESRKVRATVRGAQFVYDPAANTVTLTTPSGNTHVLQHLPDQALERMQKLSRAPIASDSAQLSVTVNNAGETVYKTQVKKTKKFLGLVPREVQSEVELNDKTGTVTETTQTSPNFIDRVLNALSF